MDTRKRYAGILAAWSALALLGIAPESASADEFPRLPQMIRQVSAESCCPNPYCCPPSAQPAAPSTEPDMAPMPETMPQAAPETPLSFDPGQSLLLSESRVAINPGGYIDNAIPRTRFQLRFDAAYDNVRPDRAEFFYAKCGCLRRTGIDRGADGPVPNVPGQIDPATTRLVETSVDYQDIRMMFEYAFMDNRASTFIELPVRFLNPVVNDNTAGLGDLNFGFKYALIDRPDAYLTFQLRAYAPSGDSTRGLGTNHYSIEPGLLLYDETTDRLTTIGEFKVWVPIDANDGPIAPGGPGVDFSGSVLQYGLGWGYLLYRAPCSGATVTPVVEFVGWSVLDGLATASGNGTLADTTINGADTTIVNGKFGVRIGLGNNSRNSFTQQSSVYIGYGHALTGSNWYKDILRLEFRTNF